MPSLPGWQRDPARARAGVVLALIRLAFAYGSAVGDGPATGEAVHSGRGATELSARPNAHVQLQGAFPYGLVNLTLRYLMRGHDPMPVAPVCCNM